MVKKKITRRKNKKKIEQISNISKFKDFLKTKYGKIKSSSKKFIKNILKKHGVKINDLKQFILIISGYGFLVNYALHFLFNFQFDIFTLFACGIAYYFIKDEFVEWIRRIIVKR